MEITQKPFSDFTRIFDIVAYQKEKYPNKNAMNFHNGERWVGYSIEEVEQRVNAIACWFIGSGFKKGDTVIMVPITGNTAWVLLDFACLKLGLITVPVHATASAEELAIVLKETEAKLLITATTELFDTCSAVIEASEINTEIFHLEESKVGYFHPVLLEAPDENLLKEVFIMCDAIQPGYLATILYTSGSSGVPKGVMLTHENIVHNIKVILTLLPLEPTHKVISFLPFSHILERAACYAYLAFGVSIYFSRGKETFASDFKYVRPYFCTSVPRVLEKMYDYLQEQLMHKNMLKRNLIRWALSVGKQYGVAKRLRIGLAFQLFLARILVLGKWRRELGGRIRYMVVGAAALQPEIGRLFSAAGIFIVEGYGMTETAPLISVNRFEPGMNLFGTVGLPIPGIEVKIDEPNEDHEGEILVRGPNVMKGYFKRDELNAKVLSEDGWFRTGDVGRFVHQRFLKITDRKKEIFKTSTGKYISPLHLQVHFQKSAFIQQCLIIGFNRPFVTALVVPNFQLLEAWCVREGIHWTSPQFMVHNIKVRNQFSTEIDRLNESLPGFQRVRDFVLCHQEWTQDTKEMTPTLKPIRKTIEENYQKEIEKMYE
jgi:long-chain acyl-CoA synthetase